MDGGNAMNHPDIDRIIKTGYPSNDYLEWEKEEEE